MPYQKLPIGDLLLQQGLITHEQLTNALAEQNTKGAKLGKILVQLGYVTEEKFLTFLAEQLKISFINLTSYPINNTLAQQLPEKLAQRFNAILLADNGQTLLIGMADPQDIIAYDEIAQFFKRPLALVRESDLQQTFNLIYRRTKEITNFAEELSVEMNNDVVDLSKLTNDFVTGNTPVTKLLRSIFEDAILVGASDIHLEPDEKVLRIRQRVDGVLQEQMLKETQVALALTQHLKMLARLNITEKRLPQDGHFTLKLANHTLDVRLSTLPTQHGESIVLRLLDNSTQQLSLTDIGLANDTLQALLRLIQLPYGMLLVTGPTGSGKTTTLYALLNKLNTPERKIITVEDPVEYQLPRVNQVQVNPAIDLDFARILRTALRQDPDVIMVGEIRDKETSTIALRAALTGHLVLATLHTNDAINSVVRLMDLESEGYLVGGALRAVIAQRLLRRICIYCREPYTPTPAELTWLKQFKLDANNLQHGKGCQRCHNTGYKGRTGIFELIEFNTEMTEALCRNDVNEFIKLAQQSGYQTLLQTALLAVNQGVTTIQEVWRVITGN
jgi:MSHA biogenesis protein MshE